MKFLKRISLFILIFLLVGCGGNKKSDSVAAELDLENTAVHLTVNGCEATISTTDYCTIENDAEDFDAVLERYHDISLIETNGVPYLRLSGVSKEQVEIRFAAPIETEYRLYPWYKPEDRIDYILTVLPDGCLQYRMDTVTDFVVIVSIGDTVDRFIVDCKRDGVEQQHNLPYYLR